MSNHLGSVQRIYKRMYGGKWVIAPMAQQDVHSTTMLSTGVCSSGLLRSGGFKSYKRFLRNLVHAAAQDDKTY